MGEGELGLVRMRRGHGDLDAPDGPSDLGAGLEQGEAERAAGGLGELGVGEANAAQRAEQDVGRRGEPQAQLVGPHGGRRGAGGEQVQLAFLHSVLHVAAGAVDPLVEDPRVDFLFGLARNARLVEELAIDLALAEEEAARTGKPARRFRDLRWSTLDSWSRRRRVVAKAEWTRGEANPRFVVTSLKPAEADARGLYERLYCARGEMENRIKECQLDLFAGRASAATMRANQLRLWFASVAYVLLCALRRIGLAHTQFAEATCGTLRLALLRIGAQVRRSVRRIKVAMASAHPYQDEFALAHARLTAAAPC